MKTTHITKAIALVMTVMMLFSCVPSAVLPVFASADSEQSTSIFDNVTLGKGTVTNTETYNGADYATSPNKQDAVGNNIVNDEFSPYEPYTTTDENHPFLPGGVANIDLEKIYYGVPATPNIPITKWSANTSVVNITGTGEYYSNDTATYGVLAGKEILSIRDHDLINEYLWAEDYATVGGKTESGVVQALERAEAAGTEVQSKNDTNAFVYNRYDAMQGKWGLTLDRNVSSVAFTPAYVNDYYGTDKNLDGSALYLTDTPYLFYSTEAIDGTQMAISLLIGTPMQAERRKENTTSGATQVMWKYLDDTGNTVLTTNIDEAAYEFRWYTITDNSARPGIGNDTLDNSMVPIVTVSDPVLSWYRLTNSSNDILDAIAAENSDNLDPIQAAINAGVVEEGNTDALYVDGAITGCIDFTQLLPLVKGVNSGRADIQYKIAQIRVDTKTADGATDSAARINYMYFGPGQAAIYTPQSTVGNEVSGSNWMYAQNDEGIGDEDPNYVANTDSYYITSEYYDWNSGYTNGWANGQAVTITNTPNDPQLMTIDTYGAGDGDLITYDQYETEMRDYYKSLGATQSAEGNWYYQGKPLDWLANFTKGSTDANSMIWKYTDANGTVQYLEAEYNKEDYNYYIMVTVPVRKWVNVLGDSRKLSMTVKTLQYGKKGTTDETLEVNPSFCFWGNTYGNVSFHGSVARGVRYANEDMLGTFGTGIYQIDEAVNYADFIDKTLSESVEYNNDGGSDDSWFDWMRSPYMYDRTVKTADSNSCISEYMAGYSFVTSMRFVMPIGSKMSVQSIKGDGNSAGLNTYSTSGQIISAYDGGTGVQPEINVTNTVPEYTATYNGDGTYTMTEVSSGIKGTISSGAAAYGPMLTESRYTIYDLLDTEMLRATGKDANHSDNYGKAKQPVYGQTWYVTESTDIPIYHIPDATNGSKYGYVYAGQEFVVYNTVKLSDDNSKWGMTGVLTKNGNVEIGWVQLWDGSKAYAKAISGVLFKEETTTRAKASAWGYTRGITKELKNSWIISNFSSIDAKADFKNGSDVTFEYDTITALDGFNEAENLVMYAYTDSSGAKHYDGFNGPTLKYANMWMEKGAHYSAGDSLSDFYLRSINGTDMEWGFKRQSNTTKNISMAMTRVFDTPITLEQGETYMHGSYPVLYLDYTATTKFKIGISLRVGGRERLWYIDDNQWTEAKSELNSGNYYKYFSFEDIMTKNYPGQTIQVVGISLYMWNLPSVSEGNVVLRRCEVWQETTNWYDEIIAANQQSGGNSSAYMNEKVSDSIQIINDSFFNVHDESADGEITVTKQGNYASGTNIGINNNDTSQLGKGFQYTYSDGTNSTSYVKKNSNKGWKAYIRMDTDNDKEITSTDTTYYSFKANEVDGVYQYHSSVGNLRIWAPAGMDNTSVVFESDRSFSTKNYKYLYYSYSMRDVDTGIAAEEASENRDDGKTPGVAVAIKSTQHGSANAYSEIMTEDGTRTWAYYGTDNSYWSNETQDNRTFKTTINAAVDLSTFDNIESVNQLVFYLSNPLDKTAEFYINYIYLSNVEPSSLIQDSLEKEQTQYYYMMDNTGDRYSARFPTLDNPTGQVTGLTDAADRVNPIKIQRGQLLSTGTYFNGDRIYGYEGYDSQGTYDEQGDGVTGSMKDIMFYDGEGGDDITDYYKYEDRGRIYSYVEDGVIKTQTVEADGVGDIYDMLWSYGRWFTGDGEGGLNILFIGDPNAPDHQKTTNDFREDGVSGGLTRRYATENYVLLRSGITPKEYTTYYDANGGEFLYDSSPDNITSLHQVTENNYYITNDVVLSYFEHPATRDAMKGDPGDPVETFLQKPGYKFSHWEHYTNYGEKDESFNVVDGEPTGTNENGEPDGSVFKSYIKKSQASDDYFKAVWVADYATYPDTEVTATFLDTNGDTFRTVTVGQEVTVEYTYTTTYTRKDRYVVTIPNATILYSGHQKVHVYGWRVKGDTNGPVFSAGQKIYVMEDTEFEPVTEAGEGNTFTITLNGAELFIPNENGILRPAEFFGATLTPSGNTYVYSNVQENYKLIAKPITATSGNGWTVSNRNQVEHVSDNTATVLSGNYEEYSFSAHEDITINYGTLPTAAFYTSQDNVYVTTSPRLTSDAQNKPAVYFTSQFVMPKTEGITFLAAGTMLTKGSYWDTFSNKDNQMRIDTSTLTNETVVTNRTYKTVETKAVKYVQATEFSSSYEYTAYIGHTKEETIRYYARAYVIYKDGDTIKVAYSDVVAYDDGSYTEA